MSVASSTTPGIGENSCSTPSIFTAVIAAPSIDDSSTRRRALPMVVPNPRSKGCAWKRPNRSVRVSRSNVEPLGPLKIFPEHRVRSFRTGRQPGLQTCVLRPPAARRRSEGLRAGGDERVDAWRFTVAESRGSHPRQLSTCNCQLVLLRIQLDDQLLLHGQVDLLARRQRDDLAGRRRRTTATPGCRGPSLPRSRGGWSASSGWSPRRDHVARAQRVGRDVDLLAVHREVAVTHELPRLRPRRGETRAGRSRCRAGAPAAAAASRR